jgi:hypothetical protein
MANITRGTKKAEKVAEANKAAGHYNVRTMFLKDGEGPWYLRFLTELDDMPSADTHGYCETKDKPEEYKGTNWPGHMPGICQNDRMFRIPDAAGDPTDAFEDGYGECYIHARDRGKPRGGKFKGDKSTPTWLTYALAVVREPVIDPVTKKNIGYKDAEVEFKLPDGTLKKLPKIVIIAQTHRMFWSGLEASLFDDASTLGDRDFRVTRKDNDFSFGVSAPDARHNPRTDSWKRYTEALELVGFDLDEEILRMASDDWYARWFVVGAVPKDGYGRPEDSEEAESSSSASPEGTRPDPEQVSAFADRLRAGRAAAAAGAEA